MATDANNPSPIENISLSANWMWPCRSQKGEDARLYAAVEALSDFCCAIGVNVPTGKDSLSLSQQYPDGDSPIRTALVTARNAPAHERVIRTLRAWNVRIDEAFFLGGVSKKDVLSAFGAHIFFDDQHIHAGPASEVVPAAVVPYREGDDPRV